MKILNFGSLNLDYIYDVDHFVQAGETMASKGMEIFCGGKGFNQSLAISKSGQEVWHAIIQKDASGQNCILLYGGANQKITKEDVDLVLKSFDEDDYLILQNEISQVDYIMKQAYKKGMRIVFNPSPISEKIKDYPLECVEYLVLNEVEINQINSLFGKQASNVEASESNEKESNIKIDVASALKETINDQHLDKQLVYQINQLMIKLPNTKIILTLGSKGSIYIDQKQIVFQEAYKMQVVDTTGAGDTFTGYLVGSIIDGKEIKEAMEMAAKAAALSVTKKGAGPSIPMLKEVVKKWV